MKNLKNKIKNMKGITLISLVVTIIVLIILAGVAISVLLGDNGLINRTKTAKDENEKAAASETMTLKITECQMKSYAENGKLPDLQYIADRFCEDNDIAYVNLEKQKVGAINNKITIGENTSIFTKLEKYPYEFEIDSSLQLASIDGVKVASAPSSDTVSREEYNALLTRISALETTGSTNPAGTVISYMADTAPTGYLPCDGQEVSRTTYSNLFSAIGTKYGEGDGSTTFNLPDLRGEFLRGTGTNSHTNQGNGSNVGTHQDGTTSPYIGVDQDHGSLWIETEGSLDGHSVFAQNADKTTSSSNKTGQWWGRGGTYSSANGLMTYTSRPTNTSVLYCIKY